MKKGNKSGLVLLLKRNISKGQLIGYSLANLVGLTVILSGILFYCDSHHHTRHNDKFFSDDYVVVSKKVDGINLDPVAFSTEEINELKTQPWVKKLGEFTSADFSVMASINMGGRGMSTYLFFESVPDDFFDKIPEGWNFDPEKRFVPIVLNRDYLALYNFGFAVPQGLPQLSEELIGTVPLKLVLSGANGRSDIFDAAVVGFSSRLNTIAVPQDFMNWANSRYTDGKENEISRLILKIDRLDSYGYDEYIKDHGFQVAGDKEGEDKVSEFMGVVSGVITAVGVAISLLALFIIILSISLLLQKNRTTLRYILLLGYSPRQISRFYQKLILYLNAIITLLAIGFTFISRLIWHKSLVTLGLGNGNILFMLGAALVYFLIITTINLSVIRSHVKAIWNT